ncbi:MAG: hypothetical protein Q9219_004582 [cf. Caloplaca sp. 3 TL-2023]
MLITTGDPPKEDPCAKEATPEGLLAAWQRDGFTALINIEGFSSPIFTLVVGPEEVDFTVHASFLSISPVFKCMCHGLFKESEDRLIELPEDKPPVIRAIISYLYSGSFLDFGTMESGGGSANAQDQLSDMYITADKYQMLDLKKLVVEKLEDVTDVEERPEEFLLTAQKIYAGISEEECPYRNFFHTTAQQLPMPSSMSKPLCQRWCDCLHSGGLLAIDLTVALTNMYNCCIKTLREDAGDADDSE